MSDTPDTPAPNRRPVLPVPHRQTDNSSELLNGCQPVTPKIHHRRSFAQACARLDVGAFRVQPVTTPAATCETAPRICIDRGDGIEADVCGRSPFGGLWSTYTRFAGACADGVAA